MLKGHKPVLMEEVFKWTAVSPDGASQVILDCTVGLGGHAGALLTRAGKKGLLIGLDLDATNLIEARKRLTVVGGGTFQLIHQNFSKAPETLKDIGVRQVDVILADLGFSSNQMTEVQRGFSFQQDGPLDMRLDPSSGKTAAQLIESSTETTLADLIFRYGEERMSRRIARFICQARSRRPIQTTKQLADLVLRAQPRGKGGGRKHWRIHPATRTFQALRIAVNGELENLERLLTVAPDMLAPGGRLVVISFHSLEDRLVKQDFRRRKKEGVYEILTPKAVFASDAEKNDNPRSRSARLRAAKKIVNC